MEQIRWASRFQESTLRRSPADAVMNPNAIKAATMNASSPSHHFLRLSAAQGFYTGFHSTAEARCCISEDSIRIELAACTRRPSRSRPGRPLRRQRIHGEKGRSFCRRRRGRFALLAGFRAACQRCRDRESRDHPEEPPERSDCECREGARRQDGAGPSGREAEGRVARTSRSVWRLQEHKRAPRRTTSGQAGASSSFSRSRRTR